MKHLIAFAGALALSSVFVLPAAKAQSADAQIAQAVLPLPDDLRAGATVFVYDPATGERNILRRGTNQVECSPENPADGFTRCWSAVTGPRRDFQAKLKAQKKSDKEISEAVAAATKDGTLKPTPMGAISYRLSGKDTVIKLLWIVSVPNATPEMLGVSTVSQRDAALKGHGLPWMMLPGTPGAHIMIPIR
jgi:hypothetical protein